MTVHSHRDPSSRHYHSANWGQFSLIYENDLSSLQEVRCEGFNFWSLKGRKNFKLELKKCVLPNVKPRFKAHIQKTKKEIPLVKPVSQSNSKQSFTNALAWKFIHDHCHVFNYTTRPNTLSSKYLFHNCVWTDIFNCNCSASGYNTSYIQYFLPDISLFMQIAVW